MHIRPSTLGLVLGTSLLLLSAWAAAGETSRQKEAAVAAAREWLSMVDAGEYDKSWQHCATYFQKAVPKKQWSQTLGAVREPLGKLLSRTLKRASFRRSLPGAPDGQYVIIQFDASFSNKATAVETVTPMLEDDGKWRVSGYYIK